LNLGKLCDKLKVQEKQIAEWAAKYTASKFKLDMTSTELTFLKSEENKGFVPLEQRLLRYFTAVESEEWEDPLEIKD
jgi:signal transduction protein with GAF and PtsI domain